MLQFVVITLEYTWLQRNEVLHGHSPPNIIELGHTISRCTQRYHKAAGQRRMRRSGTHEPPTWTPPTPVFMKINFDAAFDGDLAISDFIVSNSHGSFTHAWTGCSYASTTYAAEVEAAYQALQCAHTQSLQNVWFKGDAMNVILALNGLTLHGVAREKVYSGWSQIFV